MSANVHIMGIVNLTEDSFYAGSRTAAADVLARARQMWADGATVVDLGACSTRPGASQPSLEEEWARLEPALREMAGNCLPGNSVRSAHSGPSHCLSRPLCERTSNGPLPLPMCGGAHVPGRQLPAISRSAGSRRAHSSSREGWGAPGRVEQAPRSTTVAPLAHICCALARASAAAVRLPA